jgi:hypothetical protein
VVCGMSYYPSIDVELLFTEMVRAYPMACVLTDKIPHPDFPNADYIFHHERVVAELKRIEVDNVNSPNHQAKITAVLDRFHAEGAIKTKEVNEANWRELPTELQNEIYDITTHSIKGQIAKANRQLKETKDKLGLSSYKGCLIIVNDGVESLPPAAFVHSAFRLIRKDFSGISFFIFFTANVIALSREYPMPMHYWIGMDMEKEGKMDTAFSDNLHAAWRSLVGRKTGLPAYTVEMNDVEGFWKARNLPK